jgi:Initiator Replication protein
MWSVAHLTIDQKPHGDDFAKARELIEIRGTGALSLHDRRVMNVLYANAGQQLCDDVKHFIGIAELRGLHKGGERVKDSILRLMKTVVEMPVKDRKGRPALQLVQVLSDTTITDDDDNPTGQVSYSFSPAMRAIIKDSTLWGRVRTAVIFAFTSKYSLALYELITARINLTHVWQEDFSVQDLRELLGVPDDKLQRTPDLLRYCIKVAEVEVTGLADFGVKIEPIRTGGTMRGLVTGFKVAWWKKDIPGLKEAFSELHRSKVGRLARLTGKVETVRPLGDLSEGERVKSDELPDVLLKTSRSKSRKAPAAPR